MFTQIENRLKSATGLQAYLVCCVYLSGSVQFHTVDISVLAEVLKF